MSNVLKISSVLLMLLGAGCTYGPREIQHSRLEYNQAVQKTFQEEMLLNLVRLKYREIPEFLSVGGIAAQYTLEGTAGSNVTLPDGGTSILGLNGAVKRSERPTISYVPARGEAFQRGLLGPIDVQSLQLLSRTGWRWDRIMRTTVQYMNEVDNATSAGGPTPDIKPEYEEFHYVAKLMRQLQSQRGIELATVEREDAPKRIPLPREQLDGDFVINALNAGYRFKEDADGLYLVKDSQFTALIIHPRAKGSFEAQEIGRLLNLNLDPASPEPAVFELTSSKEGRIMPAFNNSKRQPTPPGTPPVFVREDVVVSTRSLLEVMFYLSQGIQVPTEHYAQGLVTLTVDQQGVPFDWAQMNGDLLQIYSCKHRPDNAAVAVFHEGYWFYIDDRDLNSQSTFTLLVELFGIEVRGGGAGGFLYTLNVGG